MQPRLSSIAVGIMGKGQRLVPCYYATGKDRKVWAVDKQRRYIPHLASLPDSCDRIQRRSAPDGDPIACVCGNDHRCVSFLLRVV